MAKVTQYLAEVKSELSKANWPWDLQEKGFKRFRELSDSTLVVLVATIVLGGFVALWDLIIREAMKLLTYIGG
ncbi:MAG: preprotein translocase subunit SecE [Verrucomicrobiales bacterium]